MMNLVLLSLVWMKVIVFAYHSERDDIDWGYNADIHCNATYRTHAASIHSAEDNEKAHESCYCDICEIFPEFREFGEAGSCWIGLRRDDSTSPWYWYDGTPVDYTNWDYDQRGPDPRYNCGYMYPNGKWQANPCSNNRYILCNSVKVLPDYYETYQDKPIEIRPTANDIDAEGDALVLVSISDPSIGSQVTNGDIITYTPDPCTQPQRDNGNYLVHMDYTIMDQDDGVEASSVIEISVSCVDSIVASPDYYETIEHTPINIQPTENDIDREGHRLILTHVEDPVFGSQVTNGDIITYTPEPCTPMQRDHGEYLVVMDYTIMDESDGLEASSDIWVMVSCNQRPTANPDAATVNEGGTVTVSVIENDTDPEGDSLAVDDITEQPIYGTATIDREDYTRVIYESRVERCDEIAGQNPDDASYTDRFRYRAIETNSIERLISNDATVVIQIECDNGI